MRQDTLEDRLTETERRFVFLCAKKALRDAGQDPCVDNDHELLVLNSVVGVVGRGIGSSEWWDALGMSPPPGPPWGGFLFGVCLACGCHLMANYADTKEWHKLPEPAAEKLLKGFF